ncbi:hypothetical protein L7F22_027043 [Adiantum nelumboides]|nr:hypothetical protein [Adiantum nelumboides]
MLSSHIDDSGRMDLSSKPNGDSNNQSLRSGNDNLSQGRVDVNSLLGGFDEFYFSWKEQEEYFFYLHFSLVGKETGYPVYDVKGIAICWVGSPIYYVSFGETSTTEQVKNGGIAACTAVKYRWRRLTERLFTDGVQKVTWDWKNQVLAFYHPSLSMDQVGQIAAESFQLASTNQKFVDLPGISNVGSPIDLQIATWLLWPDEESAQSFSLEQVPLLAELESFGIRVDMEGCKQARQQVEGCSSVFSVLGLFLPIPAGGNKCVGQHPIIEVIKEHRTLSKVLHSTLGSILFKARPIIIREGHSGVSKSIVYRVKGHWLQTSTATGRLSMEEPNLQQCVEHSVNFTSTHQSEDSLKGHNAVECTINAHDFSCLHRKIEFCCLLIIPRFMAHFSGDNSLIELLSRPTGDLCKIITAQWTEVIEANVTEKQRDLTKRLVYGILYGMGISALADQLECSVSEAAEKYKCFKSALPGVAKWQWLYISTLSGRRRYLDKINHGNLSERSKAERQAVNSICQGSAADLIKIAMNKLLPVGSVGKASSGHDQNEKILLSSPLTGKFRLLLQIHDELVLETEKSALREVAAFLRSCMEGAATLKDLLQLALPSACLPVVAFLSPSLLVTPS